MVESVAVSTVFSGTALCTVTLPLMVTAWPAGMLPVHETLVGVTVSVPEVAVWSPSGVALASTALALGTIVIPV